MGDDERPKDYSSLYCEVPTNPPIPPMRRTINAATNTMMPSIHHNHNHNHNHNHSHTLNPHHQQQHKLGQIWSDGARTQKRHCESTVDLRAVVAKLQSLPQDNCRDAFDTLSKHYTSVFRKDKLEPAGFRAYLQYYDEKDTYVVRLDRNTLEAVRDKLPKRGNYRYFFRQKDNTCEEVESDSAVVPFHEKDGSKHIYCQLFPAV